MRLLSMRVGTDDKEKARPFYDATFAALGVAASSAPDGYPILMYHLPDGQAFIVGAPRDGRAATYANGGTILFEADSDEAVSAWHAAGLANGGTCEGPPEPKERARGAFGAYLRDPDGNKLSCYHGISFS